MDSDNTQNSFHDIPLGLQKPEWGTSLTRTILELERLRTKRLSGPVPPYVFFQIKNIFQLLESLGSARIEGNKTTLSVLVDKIIEKVPKTTADEQLKEIFNIGRAEEFIEQQIQVNTPITRALLSEIHRLIVEGLSLPPEGEGSNNPGNYREHDVVIRHSTHIPPPNWRIEGYVNELLDFVNQNTDPQNDLLITAIAHHRMAWIHPYDNGNGRMVRMFTYALLIKQGFRVQSGRILNPTAIFCMDRDRYYDLLSRADTGTKEGTLDWCSYVLEGLRMEIEKIDSLLDREFVVKEILLPMLDYALSREHITKKEYEVLKIISNDQDFAVKSSDLERVLGGSSVTRSRVLARLKGRDMIVPIKKGGRIYTIGFSSSYLMRGVMEALRAKNFVPEFLDKND